MHVHDELVIEADPRMSLQAVCEQMGRTPPWAEGLKLRAAGYGCPFPALMRKCLSYFMGVDRTVNGCEGLMAAQKCLSTNKEKDEFGADYQVLNRTWNALSPDQFLAPFQKNYVWLTKVYESIKPANGGDGLIWATLGPKTMEIVHRCRIISSA